jgi:outer membrane protein OmpA-like peptidoglycan-associated protein
VHPNAFPRKEVQMTKRTLTILLLVALPLPALTQQSPAQQSNISQTNSSASAAPASSSQTASSQNAGTTEREPLQPVTSKDFWDGDEPNLVHLIMHPFASKKYVRRHSQPIQDRLNELDELTASNAKTIKDVDARAQHGIQLPSEKDNLADQHATDASNQAQIAQTAATGPTTRVSKAEQIVRSFEQYKATGQTEIRFRPGQSALSKQAKDALDQMAASLKDQHNYIIEVHGFAAGSGQAAIANSRMMANSVVRYLVRTDQIPLYRIYAVGMGNAPAIVEASTAHSGDGRVGVSVLKNDVMSAARP